MNIGTFAGSQSLLHKVGSIVIGAGLVAASLAPIVAFAAASVGISTINGQAPNPNVCVSSNPVTVVITGLTGTQGGNYSLDINWGDGSPVQEVLVTPDPIGNNASFSVSVNHNFIATSNSIGLFLYHGQPGGQDANASASNTISVCITPTTGGLVVIKSVDNTAGGSAVASSFSFQVDGGSSVAFDGDGQNEIFGLSAGNHTVTETAVGHYASDLSACGSNGTVSITAGATTTCTITNTYFNNAPVATDGSFSTPEDTLFNGSFTAIDPDGDSLIYVIVVNALKGIANIATAAINAFSYNPTVNENGSDSFTFKVLDSEGTESNVATMDITIDPANDAPVALDDAYSTNEDTPLSGLTVLGNDSDIDGDTLTAVLDSAPSNALSFTLNPDGSFDYTPNVDFNGTDSFTYKANDLNADSNVATVTINVDDANDSPVAVANSYSTDEDTLLMVPIDGVLGNDSDIDAGDSIEAVLDADVSNGTLVLNSDGSFDYTPDADYVGPDSFTYHAKDSQNAISSTVTVSITVNPVNDAPVSADQTLTTPQNTSVSGALGVTDIDVPADTFTFSTITGPTNGALTTFDSVTGAFTYTPNLNFIGSDTFTYKVNDGSADSNTATITIDVTPLDENTISLCSDGIDNDKDGDIDLADADCAPFIPTLTVEKVVVNDNSGTSVVADFALFIDSVPTVSGVGTTTTVLGAHVVSETAVAGYTASFSGDCDAQGNITLAVGDTKTCTITNDDDAPTPAPTPPPPSGGNNNVYGSLTNGGGGGSSGLVLGAATSTDLPAGCSALLTKFMGLGKVNDANEVKKLQQFLNQTMNAGLETSGTFGKNTDAWVRNFQILHANNVLTPWGLEKPTGLVYLTTQRWINLLNCESLTIPMPTLVPWVR